MTHSDPDRDLRELFSRMKDEDRAHAPRFASAPAVPAPRARLRRLAVTGAAAAAIIVTTLKVADYRRTAAERDRARSEIQPRVFTSTGWTSPTDFLLNTSTSHLLRAVPTFGPAHWTATDSTSLGTRHRS